MYFPFKIPESGRNSIFRDNLTTNKGLLMFLDLKVLTERQQLRFCTLSTNNQGTVYVFSV